MQDSDEGALTRLLEAPGTTSDENAAWALELLREAPAHRPRAGERQRVLLGLRRPRWALRHVWLARTAAAAAALLAATAIAWAGRNGLPRWLTALSRPEPDKLDTPVRETSKMIGLARPAPALAGPAPPDPQPVPSCVAAPSSNLPRPSHRRLALSHDERDGDSELVIQAMHALRQDGNPALARALCGLYLDRHPNGALAEEALAVTIETAVAHHDPDARALGARYLRRYPNGPFRGLARRASQATDAQ